MAGRKSGALLAAGVAKVNAAEAWRMHQKICRHCRQLTGTQRRYCAEGWELAKLVKFTEAEVRRLTPQPAHAQGQLF